MRSNRKYKHNLIIISVCTIILIIITVICYFTNSTSNTEVQTETPDLLDTPVLFTDITYTALYSTSECEEFLVALWMLLGELDAVNPDLYTRRSVKLMAAERTRLQKIITQVESDIDRYTKWETEHYYAAKVWEYFRKLGYTEAATAGILGNMMVETSGGTLDLNPTIYDATRSYYGLCQWSLYYSPHMADKSFEEQLDYIEHNIVTEFKSFGKLYSKGFTSEDFSKLQDPSKAALAFAKVYERCASGSYDRRKKAAKVAYEYFTSNSV